MVSEWTSIRDAARIPPRGSRSTHRRRRARTGTLLALVLSLILHTGRALADDGVVGDLTDKVESLVADILTRDSFIIPLVISNPTIGSGVGLAAAGFYQLDAESRVSNTTFGAYYTFNNSWVVALRQETYFGEGRHRLNGLLAAYDLNTDYYGIGYEAGSSGQSVLISERGYTFEAEYLRRIGGNLYGGLTYRGIRMETEQEDGLVDVPEDQKDVLSSGLGAALTFDTRDHELAPSGGTFLELTANVVREALGSDFDYEVYKITYDSYSSVGGVGVLAFRAMGRFGIGDVPYFDLSRYGTGSDLRGYVGGQYRDRVMYAVQAEGRFPLVWRFGAVAFAGFGGIAPTLSEFRAEELLPSVGLGLRVNISEELRINVGLDYAYGRNSDGWYVRIGEAF